MAVKGIIYEKKPQQNVEVGSVRVKGLEPPSREALDPKSSVSTYFTSPAKNLRANKYNQVL